MTEQQRPEPWPMGPFEREPHGTSPPSDSTFEAWSRDRLLEALAGVELGAYDHAILDWLTVWEPSTVAVIAGWVKRSRRDAGSGAECPGCDRRGRDVRQETGGDLVCHRCGRMVAAVPVEDTGGRHVR